MDTLQCAIVLAKFERFDWEVARRLEVGARYNALMDEHGLARVRQRSDRTSIFAQYTVFLDDRAQGQQALSQAGIPTAVHYPMPLNEQPAYQQLCCPHDTPVASAAARRVMSLPMHAELTLADQQRIVSAMNVNKSITVIVPGHRT